MPVCKKNFKKILSAPCIISRRGKNADYRLFISIALCLKILWVGQKKKTEM